MHCLKQLLEISNDVMWVLFNNSTHRIEGCMINIYTKRNLIPNGINIIDDPEGTFGFASLTGSDFQKLVIHDIDKGSYLDKDKFIDRFGVAVSIRELCTGTKSLILLEMLGNDNVIDMTECGGNALAYISLLDNVKLYINGNLQSMMYKIDKAITVNNRVYNSISEYNLIHG